MADLNIATSSFDWTEKHTVGLELWTFASISWIDENAEEHGAGNTEDLIFTKRVSGVTNNTTTHRLTIPAFTHPPTRNAKRGSSVRLSFWIMRVSGSRATPIKPVPGTESGLTIPISIISETIDDPLRLSATFADLIVYNSASPALPVDGYYTRSEITRLLDGVSGVPASREILTTAPLTGGGDLSTNRTLAIPKATGAVSGYLSAADWTTFNNKQDAGGGSPGGTGTELQYRAGASTFGALTGSSVSGAELTLGGTLNLHTGGQAVESLANPLVASYGLNSDLYKVLGAQRGTAGMAADSTPSPTVNFQIHQRPNGAVSETLFNYIFAAQRHGTNAANDGNVQAIYNLVGHISSDATSQSLGGHHDIVGVAGFAYAAPGSTAHAFGFYGGANVGSALALGVGFELQVDNSSGAAVGDVRTGTLPQTTVLSLVGVAEGAGSDKNSAALVMSVTSAAAQFLKGIYVSPGTIASAGIMIDLIDLGAGFGNPLRLPNGSYITARNAADNADVSLIGGASGTTVVIAPNGENVGIGGVPSRPFEITRSLNPGLRLTATGITGSPGFFLYLRDTTGAAAGRQLSVWDEISSTDQVLINASGAMQITSGLLGATLAQAHTIPAVASDTFVLIGATQTLTNKTLIAPALGAATATSLGITNSQNSISGLNISNVNAGTNAIAGIQLTNNAGGNAGFFGLAVSTYSPIPLLAGSLFFDANSTTTGIVLNTEGAGQLPIRFGVNNTEVARFSATGLVLAANTFIEGIEIADPAAPAANAGRLYFKDNGAGKTLLVCRFNSGAIQTIATEP